MNTDPRRLIVLGDTIMIAGRSYAKPAKVVTASPNGAITVRTDDGEGFGIMNYHGYPIVTPGSPEGLRGGHPA